MSTGFIVIRDNTPASAIPKGAVVAMGNFDGVHLGHRAVIGAALAMSKARGVPALAVTFEPTDAPAGQVLLTFAGGGRVRLDAECLEARLRDLGGVWAAKAQPKHDVD